MEIVETRKDFEITFKWDVLKFNAVKNILGAYWDKNIKLWKGWYFKKNSRKKATIQLRYRWHIGEGEIYDTCWLELSREGEKLEQHRIRQEAYDVLKSDLKQEEYPGNIIFIVLESFIPHPKK